MKLHLVQSRHHAAGINRSLEQVGGVITDANGGHLSCLLQVDQGALGFQ